MNVTNLVAILAIGVASFGATLGFADERIWLKDTMINGKPVKLCFDSGSSVNALFPQAAKRLGLKFNTAPTNGLPLGILEGDTESYTLDINGTEVQTTFVGLDVPSYVHEDVDGLMGWLPLSQNVLRIDSVAQEVTFLAWSAKFMG